ncbi:hypothetical protein Tco_1086818 [Tanacetum coccineum]
MEKNKSYDKANYKKKLYDALVESYNTDKYLFDSYGEVFSLKRTRDDSDKDQDPSVGSDRRKKRKKSSKGAESSKDSRSKEKKSTHAEEQGPKRQSFYGYASNLTSSKDVYSRRRIIAVTRLIIMKKYDYGHLEEIEVRRDDQKLYMFKEGDFKILHLQGIKDMLLLLIQQKLTNRTIDERYDLNVALRMYTRRIFIQRRVEDLQLGVESYQKKLNLTKPDIYRSNLRNKTAYTSHSEPHGIIYVDQFKRKRLMRVDELHKFSNGTLNDVRTTLHDIAAGIRMEYLPMRKWSNLDKKRARVMVQDIDRQLYYNTPFLTNIAAKANLGYYFIVQ